MWKRRWSKRGGAFNPDPIVGVVAEFVSVVGATVPTIPEGNLVPGTVRGIAQCSIVLRSADYPLILTLEVNDEFGVLEKFLEKLASKKTAYYVCITIERILRKQRNPTMKQTTHTTGFYSRSVSPL